MHELSKVIIVGESGVGKTSVIKRYNHNDFTDTQSETIGAAYFKRTIPFADKKTITLQFWDTSGQERYRSLLPMSIAKSHVAILVVDATKSAEENKIGEWVRVHIKGKGANNDCKILLVSNKNDLDDSIILVDEELQGIVDTYHLDGYVKVSAKTGDGLSAGGTFENKLLELLGCAQSKHTFKGKLQQYVTENSKDKHSGKHDRLLRTKNLVAKINSLEQKLDAKAITAEQYKIAVVKVIYPHYATIKHCGSYISETLRDEMIKILNLDIDTYNEKIKNHWITRHFAKWNHKVYQWIQNQISESATPEIQQVVTAFHSDDTTPTVVRELYMHLDYLEHNRLTQTDPEIAATIKILDFMESEGYDPSKLLEQSGKFCNEQGIEKIPNQMNTIISPIVDGDNIHGKYSVM